MNSKETLSLLCEFESRNVLFTEPDGSWPIVWERAKGVNVWDAEGKKYLDLTAAFGVAAAGHANPRVVRAGQWQIRVGPACVQATTADSGARFVYFSTDYVFDGADGPYTEASAVNPLSAYGRSKYDAEVALAGALGDRVLTLRTCAESVDQAAIESGSWVLPMKPGNFATLEVADTGIGIQPELLALVFDPFYSTKFAGRGLGLAAVIGIIGSQGGGICVRSELGRGSTFKIYLPAILGPRSVPDSEPVPTWRGEGRILVVDEEAVVRNTARHMAERLGFSVLEAGDGLEAVKLFRYYHGDLALVLLDLTMPPMSGLETFRQLREIDSNVPVVLSSRYDAQDTELPLEGVTGFLYKPYRLAEFQGLLKRTLPQRVRAST